MASSTSKINGAWVALITKTSYLQGLLVVDYCLKNTSPPSAYPLVAMITAPFPEEGREVLRKAGIPMKEVETLHPQKGEANLAEARFDDTWTKVTAFDWTEYDRVITLDCDMLISQNMDDLFELDLPADWIAGSHACACNPRQLSHYPKDWIPENCAHSSVTAPEGARVPPAISSTSPRPYGLINGGLIALTPSHDMFEQLFHFLKTSPLVPTFKFADQDLYAAFFEGRWKPVPYVYNALKTLRTVHEPLWRDEDVRNIHYILDKPWQAPIEKPHPLSAHPLTIDLHRQWWVVYEEMLNKMKGVEGSGWEIVDEYVKRD